MFFICFKNSEAKIIADSLDLGIVDFIQENFKELPVDYVIDEIRKTKISENDSKKLLNNIINIIYTMFSIILLK